VAGLLIPFIEIYSLCYVTESTSSGGILKRPSKQLLVWQFFQQNFYFIILKMKFRFCGEQDCPDWLLAEMTTLSRLTSVKTKLTTAQVIQAIIKGNRNHLPNCFLAYTETVQKPFLTHNILILLL
jgi:hypothetical protein